MRRPQIAFATFTVLAFIAAVAVPPAIGQFKVLYNLGTGGTSDPCQPQNSGIIAQGQDGNLYSTAPSCGATDYGAVFTFTPTGSFNVTYGVPNGGPAGMFSGLTLDPTDGNLYGTSHGGGTVGDGTLFKVTPGGSLNVLHSFTGGSDGYTAYAPPVIGTDGNLYGTTWRGGSAACGNGCGVVYKMTPSGTLVWSYEFDLTHGFGPYGPLVEGTDGNFYGTTSEGGTSGGFGAGVVFKITPAGKLTVLYNFCSKPACADGQYPQAGLVQGTDGNFYGTTTVGGANGFGEVFKITMGGALTVLHSMTQASDGGNPYAGLVQASDGNFYGANQSGGTHGGGTLFKITSKGVFSVLYNFDGTTGAQPFVTLLQHTDGILYGDTYQGGTASQVNCSVGTCGVIFEYNAGLKPFIKLLPATGKVGDKIGILGQGFTNSSVVKFNGVVASYTLTGSTFITATVPRGTLDGYVTVTTGGTTLKSLYKFLVHDSWGSSAAMPTPLRYPAGVGAIGSKIYVVGGITTGGTLIATNQVYNTLTNTWTTAAPLPTALANGTGAVVKGILYVIGGGSASTVVDTVYAYNPSTNTWTSKTNMLTARASIGSAIRSGVIYVIGGVNGDGVTRLSANEAYNPGTNTWTSETSMLVGKSEVAVGLLGSTIVAAGGYTTSGDTGDNEGYNSTTNSWNPLATEGTPLHDSCSGVVNGILYVAGGGLSPQSTNQSYNLTTNKWSPLSSMPVATTAPGYAVANGQLFCFGGGDSTGGSGGNFYNNVQIYQP